VIIANDSLASFLPATPSAALSSRETLEDHLLELATASTLGDETALNELMSASGSPFVASSGSSSERTCAATWIQWT
jgi:hypothetical protein